MSSLSNIEEHLEEQFVKKRRVDNSEGEPENAIPNELHLPKTMEADENKECGQIIQMNLKKLKRNEKWAEFEKTSSELALSLLDGQTEYFIMANKLCNPKGNFWNPTNTMAIISEDGLNANVDGRRLYVFAMQPFEILGECERDISPCKVLYYYEVTNIQTWYLLVGLSNRNIQNNQLARKSPNFYGLWEENYCCLAGQQHNFEWPVGAIQPKRNNRGDVIGCGLILLQENKLAIFFTLNGILMGKQIPISPLENRLFPTIKIHGAADTNFGDDPSKQFKYDVEKCPGLVFV